MVVMSGVYGCNIRGVRLPYQLQSLHLVNSLNVTGQCMLPLALRWYLHHRHHLTHKTGCNIRGSAREPYKLRQSKLLAGARVTAVLLDPRHDGKHVEHVAFARAHGICGGNEGLLWCGDGGGLGL